MRNIFFFFSAYLKCESTTFVESECANVRDNVEMRSCGFSDVDDDDRGMLEFRSDGKVVQNNKPLDDADRYTLDRDMLTITSTPSNEAVTFRFEVSAETLTLFFKEFNSPGCFLAYNLKRIN